ncbi:NADH dehydrogenase [ubiquinone] 1 beta subcomplex subunit 11, mitochondrial [Cylas formicarius]|uniref:NADH dehydrogenase [ubiquinone] 1 beta subcomplex subunit 11, mitochondrial n=1 Tax=Cylas formicarius TaxID=197179 RepID=UPI0029588815|nr:NADH dehydrogenase [ubiquinone] 1 beta subcomplex subunit 11, mitochondrial [Cylas formicarius]
MASLLAVKKTFLRQMVPAINKRLVSTSKKHNDTITTQAVSASKEQAKEPQNWISYGFDYKSKSEDRHAMHSTIFSAVTLCLVVGGFIWAYIPDYNLRSWATREAFLELRRRENAGLPLIDPNLVDPAKVELPSDEELGGTDIII